MGQCQSILQVSQPPALVDDGCDHAVEDQNGAAVCASNPPCKRSTARRSTRRSARKDRNHQGDDEFSPFNSVTTAATARISNEWGGPDCSETSHSSPSVSIALASRKPNSSPSQPAVTGSSKDHSPPDLEREPERQEEEPKDIVVPAREDVTAATKKPIAKEVKKELSDSAHRRSTLEYQAARRIQLEREASRRLSDAAAAKAAAAAIEALTKKSKPALRMPPNVRSTSAPVTRRSLLAKQNSWFTLSQFSDSEMSLDFMEDYSYSVTTEREEEDEPGSGENASTLNKELMSSWSALDHAKDDDDAVEEDIVAAAAPTPVPAPAPPSGVRHQEALAA